MKATESVEHTKEPAETPRVTISTNPMNPRVLENKTRTHLKNTRSNIPRFTPPITTTEPNRRRSKRLNLQDAPVDSNELNSARILVF